MRFSKLVAVGAVAMAACGGKTDSTQTTTQQTPAATTPPAAAAAPITGKTVVVNMVGDDKGSRYEPATVTLAAGDGIRFDGISLGPHNVAFDPATLPAAAKAALTANMTEQMTELSSKLIDNGQSYTLSFGNVPAGTYEIICVPHTSTGMKMKVTVQ